MMKIPQLGDDAVKLRFVPFALKDLAKKCLYSLTKNFITTWDDFAKVFLKKFYPVHKTALFRKNIMQNPTNRFENTSNISKTFLSNAPHHGIKKCRLCQILYDGLDYQNKTLKEP